MRGASVPQFTERRARAGLSVTAPNELLEANEERLDTGASGQTIPGEQTLATVGALNRPSDSRGRNPVFPES